MTSNATTRRRRKQDKDETKVDPVDEIEQEREVERLRQEALEQMELIHSIFSRVCEGAMFLCLVLGVASQDAWCWIHVILSIFLHWSATSIAGTAKSGSTQQEDSAAGYHKYLPLVALLILVGVFVPQGLNANANSARNESQQHMEYLHHMGLAGSNVVTMLGALYLKKDYESTKQLIAELEKSKYNYKSL